jgi:torulene dioxygenase
VLFRSGLGPREVEGANGYKHRVNHWFDNFAQVHRFQIHEPSSKGECVRVTYNSRSTCDGMIEKVKKTGKLNNVTFAAKYDPCMSLFQKPQSVFFQSRQADIATCPGDVSISVTLSANFPAEKLEAGYDRFAVSALCNKTDSDLF